MQSSKTTPPDLVRCVCRITTEVDVSEAVRFVITAVIHDALSGVRGAVH